MHRQIGHQRPALPAHQRHMELSRRGNVDGVEFDLVEHALRTVEHVRDPVLARSKRCLLTVRVRDGEHVRAIAKLMPPRKVMLRDPAGAHQADAQGPVGGEGRV